MPSPDLIPRAVIFSVEGRKKQTRKKKQTGDELSHAQDSWPVLFMALVIDTSLIATCYLLPASYCLLLVVCFLLQASCYLLLVTCYLLFMATCYFLLASCSLLPATFYLLFASCFFASSFLLLAT